MGAAGRALVAIGLLALMSCGSVHPQSASSTSAVPWLPLPTSGVFPTPPNPTPAPPFPIPPGTPTCAASQLRGETGGSSAATGSNVDLPIIFRNGGSTDCVVEGFADVTVLDSRGGVLAQAAGMTGRGTYFNDGPVVPVLLRATGGQVFMNLTWYDCRNPRASQLAVDMPGNGGRLLVKFPVTGRYYMLCDSDPHYAALARGPFSPVGIEWPPGPTYISVDISINAPPQVKAGSTLVYDVTITNTDHLDYRLSPCPDYNEFLGPKMVVGSYRLNCAPVGKIAPGASVTFEIHMTIPKGIPLGPTTLMWGLGDGRITSHTVTAPLVVTQ